MDASDEKQRRVAQGQLEPSIYVPARMVSIYVTRLLLPTPVTSNAVTLAWGIVLLIAAGLLATGNPGPVLGAAALIALAYVLDCVDGELARLRDNCSNVGSTLEQIVHWSTNLAVLAGAAVGVYHKTGDAGYLVLGLVVIIGDATFHFMYVSLRVAALPGGSYGLLPVVTRWQFYLMPINTNLVMLFALFDRTEIALWIWAVWSHLAWIVGFSLYFFAALRLEKAHKVLHEVLVSLSEQK